VQQNRDSAWLFPGERKGFALNLDNVAARVIGLALGVAPEIVQTILRHGDAARTRKHRILLKFQDERRATMTRLEKAVAKPIRKRFQARNGQDSKTAKIARATA
jgi:hypothetical protein